MFQLKSIFAKIIALHIIAIGAASVFMPMALFFLLESAATDLQHGSLTENAGIVSHYLSRREDGTWALDLPQHLQLLFSESYGRYSYLILDESGRVLFASSGAQVSSAVERTLENEPQFFKGVLEDSDQDTNRGSSAIVGAIIPQEIDGRKIWVEVTQDLSHRDVLIDDIVSSFFYRVGWIVAPIFLLLLAIDVAIFRRALRPLQHASEMAAQIGPARTEVRLPIDEMPIEIRPLVRTINEALDRLESGFRIQREFTADAAHELRTPLAILNARIDTLDDPKLAKDLRRDVTVMTRVVTQLLDIAELENFTVGENDAADLTAVCEEAAEFLARLALMQKKHIALAVPDHPILIRGNAEALFRAVRNVGENAIKHTAPDTTVEISLTPDGAISVSDHGPGISAQHRHLIFQRFWRVKGQRATGAGLGLSIVRRVMEAHNGTVSVENREAGGAEFTLKFKHFLPPTIETKHMQRESVPTAGLLSPG